MTESNSSSTKFYVTASLVTVFVIIGGTIAWRSSVVEHLAIGSQTQSFIVECDFDRFRQLLVRKNATAAIVGHSGMKLLDEHIQDIELDTSADDRPLLNAIRGKSKSNLSAVKLLTVQLDDPTLEANQLELRQIADVQESKIEVVTASIAPAGRLENYSTTLHAVPDELSTKVTVSVDMTVRVRVPKLFVWRADERVQQAADDAIAGQVEAMKQFVANHIDEQLILPEFGGR